MKSHTVLSLRQAIAWILLSILFITVPITLGVGLYRYIRTVRIHDPTYNITTLLLDSKGDLGLDPILIAELLNLSFDEPQNLYRFSSKEAQKKLLAFPVIEEAHVHKLVPGSLMVTYRLRQPLALIGDFSNTAVDHKGIPFPWQPFYKEEQLPTIYLGLRIRESSKSTASHIWGQKLNGRRIELAIKVLESLKQSIASETVTVKSVDVSQAFALSYGQKEIVVTLDESRYIPLNGRPVLAHFPRILRLSLHHYQSELANYQNLCYYLQKNEKIPNAEQLARVGHAPALVVDLRIPQLAFLSYQGG